MSKKALQTLWKICPEDVSTYASSEYVKEKRQFASFF
jgi:hypothetical protein